ncbi:MAG: DUF6596 domain-containing protein [bacterium]
MLTPGDWFRQQRIDVADGLGARCGPDCISLPGVTRGHGAASRPSKNKIRDAGIAFEVPAPERWPERREALLEAVYAAYVVSWQEAPAGDVRLLDTRAEARWLAELLVGFLPTDPEVLGLFALLNYIDAREAARWSDDGEFVPLLEQNHAHWDIEKIAIAEKALFTASRARQLGRYQLEAAIQSAHVARVRGGADWAAILGLYDALLKIAPTLGAAVSRAVVLAKVAGPKAGLHALEEVADRSYQPYWAARADLEFEAGLDAHTSYDHAMGMAQDAQIRRYLAKRRDRPR